MIGKDGKPVTEEKEITIPAYKVVSVFDVSQTEGKELPDIAVDALTGDVEQYSDFFAALEKTSPVPIGFEKIEGGAHGYYHLEDKRIALDEGMSELQTLKTAIHEIAHAKLHDIDLNAPKDEQQPRVDRRTREVEAESVSMSAASAASRQIDTLAVHPIRSMARFSALRCSQTPPKPCAIFCKRNGAAVSSFRRGTSRRISPPCATG